MALKARPIRRIELVFHPERDPDYRHFAEAERHPFDTAAVTLGRRNAWWLADAALLAYWDEAHARPRFAGAGLEAAAFNQDGVDGYLASGTGFAIVSFRGTEPDQSSDIFDDARFALVPWDDTGASVHAGFLDALNRVWPLLAPQLEALAPGRRIWFTGHSLGAALATLAAARFAHSAGVCTLGSPRVGNRAFASAFAARFGGRARRYVADTDVVTHVPPPAPLPYKHVDELQQIDPAGAVSPERPALSHFFNALFGDPQHLRQVMSLLRTGSMTAAPKFLLDHMPAGYTVDIWNDYAQHGD
jgi:triacylglycerol lipase